MRTIEKTTQQVSNGDMVICICPKCSQVEYEDQHGVLVPGAWVHPGTRRKHLARLSAEPEEVLMMRMLAEDFQKIACIKVPDNTTNTSSSVKDDADSVLQHMAGGSDSSFVGFVYQVMYFIAWLYLACGMTRENCQTTQDHLIRIIYSCSQVQLMKGWASSIPQDVHTINKYLDLEATLERYVCCVVCYSINEIKVAPAECGYRELPNMQACGAELFFLQTIHPLPSITRVSQQHLCRSEKAKFNRPLATFIVQGYREWLIWFLSLPGTKEAIESWSEKCHKGNSEEVSDYNQSSAWYTLYPRSQTSTSGSTPQLPLAFSLFVDWFNLLGNKISGRQVSIGVLALHCLNLLPQEHHMIKNTYLAGVVPAPNQPDMITISKIL
ncbi:hypothetical protein CROQUDRAFT_661367 [Cronartium quercuum f. sp. fusiforme G11]|uniref:Uncharacterized protein n=1 Tax=Cronartium quercuum f. sp. fusiforme G11 TaxID=708437 RepID=A0A9P6NGW4_9BASI|nr:hypothetical protein CROQUDRAFT_661367 [Cronartium quercuum f. sp. fusiforme G11]